MTRTATPPPPVETATQRHIRGSSFLLIGRMLAVCLNLAVQVLMVRYLAKSDYGAFAYALAAVSLGSSVVLCGFSRTFGRFGPIYQERGDYDKLLGMMILTVGTIVGLGVSMVLIVFGLRDALSGLLVSDPLAFSLLLTLVALSPVQALDSLFGGMLAVFASPRAIFFRRHVLGPSLKLVVVLLLIYLHASVHFLAVGYLVAGSLGTLMYVVALGRVLRAQGVLQRFRLVKVRLPTRELFGFSLPLVSSDVVLVLRSSLVILLLEYFRSTSDVAVFRAVLPIAQLNMVVYQSFRLLFTPAASRMFVRGNEPGMNELYWQTAAWISVLSFPVFAISFSQAQPLTIFLFGARYAESGLILAILSVGFFFNATLGFNGLTLRVYGKVREIVGIDAVATVVAVVMNLLMIPRYGALGGAIATCATLVAHNLLYQAAVVRLNGIESFQRCHLRLYSTIVLAALGLLLIQVVAAPPLYVAVVLSAGATVLLLASNATVLQIERVFPEVLRFTVVRHLLGASGG